MSAKVSVVLPVYNAESFIGLAMESILTQSFRDFELIAIDDGSTDKSLAIMQSYALQDERIKLISRENKGLVDTLNEGITLAKGEYIARQDADDISKPDRLKKQVTFLEENTHTIIVGSSIEVMNDVGTILHEHRILLNDPELRQELLIRSPFAHGSVMFRRSAAIHVGLYRKDYWPAEDYDFWLRLSTAGNLANIDEPLYIYREHEASISSSRQEQQIKKSDRVRSDAWKQVNKLIKGHIRVSAYKKLPHRDQRVPRIFSNIMTARRQAIKLNSPSTAVKLLRLIALDPTSYRKLGGHMKRKVARK